MPCFRPKVLRLHRPDLLHFSFLRKERLRMAFPGAPHQRPPCVKGAVTLIKRDWGIAAAVASFCVGSACVAIPQSKIKDFCQLPLHKGAFSQLSNIARKILMIMHDLQNTPFKSVITEQKNRNPNGFRFFWRYRPDLNWRMRVLQTLALPLGHGTI